MSEKKKNLFFFTANNKINFLFEEKQKGLLKLQESLDGLSFVKTRKRPVIKTKKTKENLSRCQDFRVSLLDNKYFLTYKKKIGSAFKVYGAISKNLTNWEIQGVLKGIKFSGSVVPDFFYDNDRVMYLGEKNIKIAYSEDLKKWEEERKILLKPRPGKFDSHSLQAAAAFVKNGEIILFYYAQDKNKKYSIGMATFSFDNPEKLLYRSEQAIWTQSDSEKIKPISLVELDDKIIAYWEREDKEVFHLVLPPVYRGQRGVKINLQKISINPIISPISENFWEALAAFNPTVFEHNGKVHILYRAMGHDAISTVGYAISEDGINISERCHAPIYVPREKFEGVAGVEFDAKTTPKYMSGGGWGGCEDARVTIIEDKVYLMYAAFDGHHEPEVAISSIPLKDFMKRKWQNWTMPKLITCSRVETKNPKAVKYAKMDRPGLKYTGEKDATILPEKVNGKYVIFHRIWPNIVLDFVDSLDFDGKTFLRGEHIISVRPDMWDSFKICVAATPIKIKEGWLVIYNGVDKRDMSKYKMGAMILDKDDPTKVLYRSSQPILEPEEHYENGGLKYGIVFGGGALVKNGILYVYYGGSDQHTCVATHNLADFVAKLKEDGKASLEKIV